MELKRQAALLKAMENSCFAKSSQQDARVQDESEASWRRRFIIETLQAHRILENRESLLHLTRFCRESGHPALSLTFKQGKLGVEAREAKGFVSDVLCSSSGPSTRVLRCVRHQDFWPKHLGRNYCIKQLRADIKARLRQAAKKCEAIAHRDVAPLAQVKG